MSPPQAAMACACPLFFERSSVIPVPPVVAEKSSVLLLPLGLTSCTLLLLPENL